MIVAPNADGRRERSGSSLSLSIVERCKDFRDPIGKDPQLRVQMPIAGVDQMQWVSGARPVVQNSPQLASCQMRRGHEAKRLPYPHPGQQCAQVSRALIHGNNRLTLDSQALVAAMEVAREWLSGQRGEVTHDGVPELEFERTRSPRQRVARESRENVPTGGAPGAARVPDGAQTRTCQPKTQDDPPGVGGRRRRSGLSAGKFLQPRVQAPLRPRAWSAARRANLTKNDSAYVPKGMARFDDVLSPADAEAIHEYLIDQAWQLKRASDR